MDPSVRQSGTSNLYSNLFLRPQAYTSTVAALLDVRYVAAAADLAVPLGWQRVYTGEIQIYENPTALPQAYLVGNASVMPVEEVRERLASPGFDPRKEVLLEQDEAPPALTTSTKATGSSPGETRVSSYKRNSVTVEADVKEPSWLVMSDPNYPGWSATVDGREQKVYTAYYLMRAVPLTPGRHTVEFKYWPTLYWPALVVSLTALVLMGAVIVGSTVLARRTSTLNRTLIQSSSNL